MRAQISLLAAAIALGSGPASGAEPAPTATVGQPAGRGQWVLSPRGYWRHHCTFRPAQTIGADGKLEFLPTRYAAKNTVATANQLASPDPPGDWFSPDFDDSSWCVGRAPLPWLPEMDQDGEGPYSPLVIRGVAGRTRFIVPDPSKTARATLELTYHGGVIAYVNGREVGRGHIPPAGLLAEQGFAEPYPQEAYRPVGPEQTQQAAGLADQYGFWAKGTVYHPWRVKPEALGLLDRVQQVRRRRLSIEVPPAVLRPGVNVLAIDNRVSPVLRLEGASGRTLIPPNKDRIPHIGIVDVSLKSAPAGAVLSADLRPEGVQVWVEDIHRQLLEEDFLEPGVPQQRTIRLAAPRNGACSGQAVVGTSRELAGLTASLSELVGSGGAKIPAGMARVRWGRSLSVREIRRVEMATSHPSFRVYMQDRCLIRYRGAPVNTWVIEWAGTAADQKLLRTVWTSDDMRLHDQLAAGPPARVPANVSLPVWLTVEVPPDAVAGGYRGQMTIQGEGMAPVSLEVRLQVFDFRLPDPRQFTAYAGIDESPWSLAKWHKAPLWSEPHWKLVEESIRQAGKLAARVAGIPVIHRTELDNGADAMVRWVKRADPPAGPEQGGDYDFDFTIADRYLDLWRRYCHSQSDVIVYLVLPANEHGRGGGTGAVTLVDPASRTESPFTPPQPDPPDGRRLWLACARAIREHFNSRGIRDENIHWGLFYDYIGQAGFALAEPLAREIPTIGWARSSHEGRKIHGSEALTGGGQALRITWNAAVRAEQRPPFAKDGRVTCLKGWKDPAARLLLPRADSDVSALSVFAPLWQMRHVQEMPITSTYRGFARICVDGWGRGSYFGPYNSYVTYPADGGGVDGSAQFEVLREGLQETEARVFLERQDSLPPAVQNILDLRTERMWMIPPRPEGQRMAEYWTGWQESSWDLYAAAAQVAGGRPPGERERAEFFDQRPAMHPK